MKSTLRIPCYNEWHQYVKYLKPSYFGYDNEIIEEKRSNIYETLMLLKPKIDQWLFQKVIITNDWSNDNSLSEIQNFKNENFFGVRDFMVIDKEVNQWKTEAFIQAYKIANQFWQDNFVMTDADLVFLPNDNLFEKLSMKKIYSKIAENREMLISFQKEYDWKRSYNTFTMGSSWTRSIIIPKTIKKLQELWIYKWYLPAQWYGLELMLNLLFGDKSGYINNLWNNKSIPHFLQAMRKWQDIQKSDIQTTQKQMIKMMTEKWIVINKEYFYM